MPERTIAETRYGKIRGKEKDGLLYFEGVPYGADTSDENRFLPPKPPIPWNDVKDCTHAGPKCCQWSGVTGAAPTEADPNSPFLQIVKQLTCFDEEILGQQEELSEDCLRLNVLTPDTDGAKRPVLFYIHGGGFGGGSGVQAMAAARLVKEENVVVVSMNGRLSAFGYLYLGHLDEKYKDSGNVGLLDIVAALRWVRDNIASFGGDPDNVTLLGESGGGMKICCLLAMQEAAGLFHKAFAISGVLKTGAYTKEQAAGVTNRILEKLGIAPKNFEKLLTLPPMELLAACQDRSLFVDDRLMLMPVGDDIHIPENKENKFLTYEWSKDIPFITGSSECESGLGFYDLAITKDEAIRRLTDGAKGVLLNTLPMDAEKARALYAAAEQECAKDTPPWKVYVKAASQWSTLGQGAKQMIRARTESGAKCWLYNMALESEFGLGPTFRCSWHTADLMAFFRRSTTQRDETLSVAIGKLLGRFMRTGDPYEEEYRWLPYDESEDQLLNFDEQIEFIADPLKKTREVCKDLNPRLLV